MGDDSIIKFTKFINAKDIRKAFIKLPHNLKESFNNDILKLINKKNLVIKYTSFYDDYGENNRITRQIEFFHQELEMKMKMELE